MPALKPKPFKAASLPPASKSVPGTIIWVPDASGGACLAVSDGSAWKKVALGATVT